MTKTAPSLIAMFLHNAIQMMILPGDVDVDFVIWKM